MTLRRFTIRIFGAFVLISAILAMALIVAALRISTTSFETSLRYERVRLSEELQIHLLSTNREWFLFELTGEENHRRNRIHQEREVHARLADLQLLHITQEDKDLLAKVHEDVSDFLEARAMIEAQKLPATEAYQNVNPYLRVAHQSAATLTRFNLDQATRAAERSHAEAELMFFVAIAVMLLLALLVSVAFVNVRSWVFRPIRNLSSGILGFRRVNPDQKIKPEGVTEIQQVAEAFNDLTWRLVDQKNVQLRFLAGVAHDLKNPLGAIKMSTHLLNSEEHPEVERKEMVEIISRQTDQLNRMVGDFLDATRIESGHLNLRKATTDLRTLVRDAVLLHRQVSDRHEISFTASSKAVECQCDSTRLTQVINNLLNNAIKYSPNGGEIIVSLLSDGENAEIRVSDEGIGISEADIAEVFEPFRRTKQTKDTIPGVGLGLSVSKHIIEGHGGRIGVESQVGKGSVFTVTLPLVQKHLKAEAPAGIS